MTNSIYLTANKFKRKTLKNKVDFKTVSAYLQSIGFAVVLYNCNKDNDLLIKYDLVDFSKTVKGFTVYRKDFKAVFIDDSPAREEKLCVLIHETAHIVLGHIDKKDIQDARLMEMEADAFAHQVLYPQKDMRTFNVLTVCVAILCILLTVCFVNSNKEPIAIPQTAVSAFVPTVAPITATENQSDIVYVTPSGTKYHRSDCRYVKNKNCSTYQRAEAEQKYSACSVCRP